jgi:hypothetical protein
VTPDPDPEFRRLRAQVAHLEDDKRELWARDQAFDHAPPRSLGLPWIIIVAIVLGLLMAGAILGGM